MNRQYKARLLPVYLMYEKEYETYTPKSLFSQLLTDSGQENLRYRGKKM